MNQMKTIKIGSGECLCVGVCRLLARGGMSRLVLQVDDCRCHTRQEISSLHLMLPYHAKSL
jgi:hypothetical protein